MSTNAFAGDEADTQAEMVEAIKALAERAANVTASSVPDDVGRLARHCLLDWLGVAIAAAPDALIGDLISATGTGSDGATLIGRTERASLADALWINGTAGHLLDYDDVHSAIPGHVTVAIAPVVLALGECSGASGTQLLTSFVAGFEAMCEFATLVGKGHAKAGFHPTATLGAFGATIATCHAMSATPLQMQASLCNASTMASGLRAAFGTPLKSVQVGRASVNGYQAAMLAMRGINAGLAAVAGRDGFMQTHGATPVAKAVAPHNFYLRDVLFKFDASCFVTHAPIACLRQLMATVDLCFDRVLHIEVRVHPSARDICAIPDPSSALEAKFSIQHVAAMTLAGLSTQDIQTFGDAMAYRELAPWRRKIRLVYDSSVVATRSVVTVNLVDGSSATADHDSEVVDPDKDRQERMLCAKFEALAAPVLGAEAASTIQHQVLHFSSLSTCKSLYPAFVPR